MSLEVVKGPMFAGKTTTYINRVNARVLAGCTRLVLIKHAFDTRYDAKTGGKSLVHSHDGITLNYHTLAVKHVSDALPGIESILDPQHGGYIAFDEGQFFVGLKEFVITIRSRYPLVDILVAGLDMDFRAQPFGDIPELFNIADTKTQLRARCSCGSADAEYTHRKIHTNGTVLVGGADIYEPLCAKCYDTATAVPPSATVDG